MSAPAKKLGRPKVAPELRRSVRLQIRTYPEVLDKAGRVGAAAVEAAIRQIKETPNRSNE